MIQNQEQKPAETDPKRNQIIELSGLDLRVTMPGTFKKVKGNANNFGRELEIIKKHSRTENTVTEIKASV